MFCVFCLCESHNPTSFLFISSFVNFMDIYSVHIIGLFPYITQGLLNSIKHVKKEQALLQAAESQSKVSEIYNAVQRWDSVASLLPDLVMIFI